MPPSSPSKTPSPSKSRKLFPLLGTPSSSRTSSPSKSSPSPNRTSARGSSTTYSGTYYGPNTRKACKEWATPRRPPSPASCPQGHSGFIHLFVGMSQAQAGRWGALCHACPEQKKFFQIKEQDPVPKDVKDRIEALRAEEEAEFYGHDVPLTPSTSQVNDVDGRTTPGSSFDNSPFVIDETYLPPRTTEEFLYRWRRDEQEKKDAALARLLQEEEDREASSRGRGYVKQESLEETRDAELARRLQAEEDREASALEHIHNKHESPGTVSKGKYLSSTGFRQLDSDGDRTMTVSVVILSSTHVLMTLSPHVFKSGAGTAVEHSDEGSPRVFKRKKGSSPTDRKDKGKGKARAILIEVSSSEEDLVADQTRPDASPERSVHAKKSHTSKGKGKATVVERNASSDELVDDDDYVFIPRKKVRPDFASRTTKSNVESDVEILDRSQPTLTTPKPSNSITVLKCGSRQATRSTTITASDSEIEDILKPSAKRHKSQATMNPRVATTSSASGMSQTRHTSLQPGRTVSKAQLRGIRPSDVEAGQMHDNSDDHLSTPSLD